VIALRTFALHDERSWSFAALEGRRVLVYWPHGLGDFVHFGYVVPQLEPSNAYFITRFGDDFVHLFDGARGISPIYSGVSAIGDGSARGTRHLGVEWKKIRNRPAELMLPEPLASRVRDAGIDTVLYTDYPEPEGRNAFPFHTKARALIRKLVSPERLRERRMEEPLPTALRFDVPQESRARIVDRLRSIVGSGERLYLLGAGGHTTPAKSWPRESIDAFSDALPEFDAHGRLLALDEPTLEKGFGDLGVPFAHVLVTLIKNARATIGVAAGPLHAAMAMRAGPVVGIWLAHYPDWYDEFYRDSLHLTGPAVHAKQLERRKATLTTPPALRARTISFPQRVPTAGDVFAALRELGVSP
jgi:hypothetical protein